MKAVVMAGGEGSRLRPITANLPKPLVPVCNQPIMEHILTLLKRHGYTDVVSTVHYLANEIQSYFGDGSEFGVQMAYSVENTPLGTAGSVKNAEGQIREGDEPFLIISGDALTDCDLTKALQFHKDKGSLATLILYRVPNPLEFGVVITEEDGRIVRFLEKPGWSEVFSDTVNTGMYILQPEVLDTMEAGKSYDWSRDIFPRLLEDGRAIYGYVMDGYWADIGTLTQYREAQEDLLSGRADLPLFLNQTDVGVYCGLNCSIDRTATLVPPVMFGHNVKVRANAKVGPYTVVGDSCFIEENAVVERTVTWDSAYIGASATVTSAIVGSRVTIKKDCVVGEDAVIGDRCLIDVGCTIRPRVKLWPDKMVERGSTLTMSLVYGNKWRGALFRELGVAGLSNIEITPDFAVRIGAAFGSVLPRGSKVLTSRDSTRSSRMTKRAIISSLLSVGCDVLDLRGIAVPISRHFIQGSGAAGAVSVRKLPGNSRVTLIEMLDTRGNYLSQNLERKVESAFFREDFNRADPDDLGVIDNVQHAVEQYQQDFFAILQPRQGKRLRVVADYGYSALGPIYPPMLSKLGVEAVNLNTFNDSKLAPRTSSEVERHIQNVSQIVTSLGYDMGILFTNEGERLTVVDDKGVILSGNRLLAAFSILVARTQDEPVIAMSVTAPTLLEDTLVKAGAKVVRTRAGTRALMSATLDAGVTFAGDDQGGFIFPEMHSGFDAPFGLGKLILMLQETGLTLSEIARDLPEFHVAYGQARVPWEAKGTIMRRITEEDRGQRKVDLLDGVKIIENGKWALVLPDPVEPLFHVYSETDSDSDSADLVQVYVKKIEAMQGKVDA